MLSKMHTPVHFMGLCRFAGVILELPLWLAGIRIMDLIGLETLQVMCLLGNSMRLYGYGRMTDYHDALYMEILHGFTFALPYLSMVVYLSRTMPEDLKATMTTFTLTIFIGLGTGLGVIIGGVAVDYFLNRDVQALFRLASTVSFVLAALFAFSDLAAQRTSLASASAFYQRILSSALALQRRWWMYVKGDGGPRTFENANEVSGVAGK